MFTNADEVELYKNDHYVASFRTAGWDGLPHGPVKVDDLIGCMLETVEGFPKEKARLVKTVLLSAGKHGLANLPLADKGRMLLAMKRYGMSLEEGVALFGKYVGNWGGEATRWRFDGKKDGKVVVSQTRCPGSTLHLEVRVSHTALREGDRYDMAAVRVRVLDENGNLAPYAQLPIKLTASGAVALAGPELVTAEGGMTGCYVKTLGCAGKGSLTLETAQTEPVTVAFTIEKD